MSVEQEVYTDQSLTVAKYFTLASLSPTWASASIPVSVAIALASKTREKLPPVICLISASCSSKESL